MKDCGAQRLRPQPPPPDESSLVQQQLQYGGGGCDSVRVVELVGRVEDITFQLTTTQEELEQSHRREAQVEVRRDSNLVLKIAT